MKKMFLFNLVLFCSVCAMAQRTDTLYYDSDWLGVDDPLFASAYRVMRVPVNPGQPIRFKDYDMNGSLLSDGVILSIDRMDDSNSKYRQVTEYYRNGNKKMESAFQDGELHGAQTMYYEDGAIQSVVQYDHGIQRGTIQAYMNDGSPIVDGVYENDRFSGVMNEYENGRIVRTCNFLNGVLHGPYILYESGSVVADAFYDHGFLNGVARNYNSQGTVIRLKEYQSGLPVGRYETRDGGNIVRTINKTMKCAGNTSLRISASFRTLSLPTSEQQKTTVRSNFWSVLASTVTGAPVSQTKEVQYKDQYTSVSIFEIYLFNNAEQPVSCSLENAYVEYIRNGKRSKRNMAMSQKDLSSIMEAYASYTKNKALREAADTAESAATQTMDASNVNTDYDYQHATAQANADASANAASASASGALGGVYGANNRGYAAGAAGGAFGASTSRSAARGSYYVHATDESSRFARTYGSSSSSSKDGFLQYQIYAEERKKADAVATNVDATVAQAADYVDYHFTIDPTSLAQKWIGVMPEKKFDTVRVTFTVNGEPYTVEFDYATELNL